MSEISIVVVMMLGEGAVVGEKTRVEGR